MPTRKSKKAQTKARAAELAKDPDHYDADGRLKRGRPKQKGPTHLSTHLPGLGYDQKAVIAVIHKERGLLNEIAISLGTSRRRVREYIMRNNEVAAALKEAREAMGDFAEKKLYELIEAGDVRCITYYLSTVHKARGYGIKKGDGLDPLTPAPTHVQTINILSIPNGQFVSKGDIEQLALEKGMVLNGAVAAADAPADSSGGDDDPVDFVDVEPPPPSTTPRPGFVVESSGAQLADLLKKTDDEDELSSCLS